MATGITHLGSIIPIGHLTRNQIYYKVTDNPLSVLGLNKPGLYAKKTIHKLTHVRIEMDTLDSKNIL